MPVVMYGSETMIWKERFRIRAIHMDNFKSLLDIRRMDRGLVLSDERIDEGVL